MTSKTQIEAMLQREGLTLDGLPERADYTEKQCSKVYREMPHEIWAEEKEILHLTSIVERLCLALTIAQRERDAAVSDAIAAGCFTCRHNSRHSREEPCVSCKDFGGWEWRGIVPKNESEEADG